MSRAILQQILKQTSNPELVSRAFEFAKMAHQGQKRASGEDYISHPLATAKFLSEWGLDDQTIAAGLLHDVVDDTAYTLQDIEKEFGQTIAFLVNGVSKLGRLRIPKGEIRVRSLQELKEEPVDPEVENLRKMFFAMAEDVRVILIKLADRMHNMQTLGALPPDRRSRIAKETMEIFAPIANRLGMGEIKGQLEDLAFPYLYPKEFTWLMDNVKTRYEERKKYLASITPILRSLLEKEGVKPLDIHTRAKHYWSLYQKLLHHDMNLGLIYDLVALRIILDTTENCYKALGILHQHFKPLPGLIKDYIAFPKPNHYRSLHTTCFCVDGKITEIQIKTVQMHQEAEYGIAAHWAYKEGVNLRGRHRRKFAWVQQLIDWQKRTAGSREFLENLKIDFFKHRIFVFTPKGDVIDLPEGATPVDFAYAIHSDIGNHYVGAKVNGKLVALDSPLKNGEVVEILVDKKKRGPSPDWLEFVKTSTAKSRIREFLKKASQEENMKRGITLLNQALESLGKENFSRLPKEKIQTLLNAFPFHDIKTLLAAIGEGSVSTREVLKTLFREEEVFSQSSTIVKVTSASKTKPEIALAGTAGLALRLAKCCSPQPTEPILGYITQNRGASVHKENCENLLAAKQKWPQKIVEATWISKTAPYVTSLICIAQDRIGLLRDLSSTISAMGINIISCKTHPLPEKEDHHIIFQLEVDALEELAALLKKLKQIEGVKEVKMV